MKIAPQLPGPNPAKSGINEAKSDDSPLVLRAEVTKKSDPTTMLIFTTSGGVLVDAEVELLGFEFQ